MKLTDIGEFGLIKFIAESHNHTGGIGDDCAILPYNENESLLVSTDMLVEGHHFLSDHISPYQLGYKTLAVNISDIAAMCGVPLWCFLSWSLPKNIDQKWVEEFFKGLNSHGIPLMGGDTTAGEKIVINVTIIGKAEKNKIKLRKSAQLGDIICVTDSLGDSAAGLHAILNKNDDQYLIDRHYLPRAHIEEGKWLGQFKEVHAMMDVSDGIASDLRRICEQSNCGANINTEMIPISPELKKYCQQHDLNPLDFAISGGEDYCLLVTVAPTYFDLPPFKMYPIGRITKSGINLDGGFNHFS